MRRGIRPDSSKQSQQDQDEDYEQGGVRDSGLHLDEVCRVQIVGSSVNTVLPMSAVLRYDDGDPRRCVKF